ncbi:ricin-type beta-trefoil lectin domain protein [Streptomyces sp. NPDC050418]|uniref:ricin-type beta-trefoil lectin domain protein n=1 Tax=Streptomyces sp. NPDC050418 TaxID=3365612 RepID=UPI0037938BAB
MAQSQHENHEGAGTAPAGHALRSDAALAALLGRGPASAYPALRELRLRHGAFLTSYARQCTVDDAAAKRLVTHAFTLAAEEAARGLAAPGAFRHHLLLLVRRAAADWAADGRAARLSVEFPAAARSEHPVLLRALRTLPVSTQAVLWYALVDEEADERIALFLGATPGAIRASRDTCLTALRRAFLRTYLREHGDAQCQGYSRLIENATSPENPRHSEDLAQHLATCDCCDRAHTELRRLVASPREALGRGLLGWGAEVYVRPASGSRSAARAASRSATRAASRAASRTASRSRARVARHGRTVARGLRALPSLTARTPRTKSADDGGAGHPSWLPSRRLVLGSAALGIAVAPLLLLALAGDGEDPGADDPGAAPSAPSATVTVTASPSPTHSPEPSPSKTSKRPSKPPASSKPPATAPRPALQDGRFAQVVSVGNGRCLTVKDGEFAKGTDVVADPCGPSDTQRWRLDANRGVIVSHANPDYCLDTRGDTDRGVGIWKCSSVDNGTRNLWFTVDASGTIRPVIQLDHAVTVDGSDVTLEPIRSGDEDQRWEAGLAPV